MKTKKLLSLLLAAAMLLSFTACGGNSNQSAPSGEGSPAPTDAASSTGEKKLAEKQEFIYQTGSEVQTMDPALASSTPNWAAQALCCENLVSVKCNMDGTTKYVPGVAESWDTSSDGLTWTFHLRKNAVWADGTPVTANDFVYTWQRTFDPNSGAVYAWMVDGIIKNSSAIINGEMEPTELGVKAVDDNTFEMTLEKPSPFFLIYASFPTYAPVRKDLVEKYGSAYGSVPEKTMGNGPFVLKSWDNSKLVYEKSENYWNKEEVYLTKFTRQVIKEVNAVAQSLMANEIDTTTFNDAQWNKMIDETGMYNVTEFPNSQIEYFLFNCQDSILSNQKIRLAISLAFDRERFNKEALEGRHIPAYAMVPACVTVSGTNFTEACGNKNQYIKDLQKQYPDPKALFIEGMKELGLGEDPSKVEIHYITRGTTERSKKWAEWTKQQLEEAIGFKFVIDMTEWNIMYDLIDEGKYQIAQGGWTADFDDPSNFLDNFHTKNGYYGEKKLHWSGAKSEEYNKLIEDAMAAGVTTEERIKLYCQAEQILMEEAPISPQYSEKVRSLTGKYVDNYYYNPSVYENFVGVKLYER